jgi:hypothetical protein
VLRVVVEGQRGAGGKQLTEGAAPVFKFSLSFSLFTLLKH